MIRQTIIILGIPLLAFLVGFVQPAGGLRDSSPGQSGDSSGRRSTADAKARQDQELRARLTQQIGRACYEASEIHRAHNLVAVFEQLDSQQLAIAATIVSKLPEEVRSEAWRALFACWVLEDPQSAGGFVMREGDRNARMDFSGEWAAVDPLAAVEWIKQTGSKGRGEMYGVAAAIAWSFRDDPHQAVEVFLRLPRGGGTDSERVQAWKHWAALDVTAALARAFGLGNAQQRAEGLHAVMARWAEVDADAARAWLRNVPDERTRAEAAVGFIAGMAKGDPETAVEVARAMPEGRARDEGLTAIAHALFFSNRALATEIVAEVPLDPANKTLGDFYFQWCLNDGGGAAVRALLANAARSEEDRVATEAFMKAGPDTASIIRLSFQIEEKVAALAEVTDVPANDFRRTLLEQSVEAWSSADLSKARAWVEALPEGDIRDRALSGMAGSWFWQSRAEASAWIETLSVPRDREAAMKGFARTMLPKDPDGAVESVRTIRDPSARVNALMSAWQQWATTAPVEAENWRIRSPILTAAERDALASHAR
jgi:hypothetical protein